ncbi:protein-methionine-sulfoxide reductase heme-binding subunit MsrQ [Candidatus Albibeggiatoa sp. nov. NOAA]|uniref:sulfite oxidase heme-binding subunit YedZ n=1 Tax=Candidatus Albibeggiatoa sp. nov. NOAA TaxID=3162724 RepID=UPI0032F7691F|nr:sulfoxide reductase heme-binding subunit YedZ [Thiotrichaceae bacterium]
MFSTEITLKVVKPVVFILCLLPAMMLVYGFLTHNLGADPIQLMLKETGEWALRLLLATLAVTPIRHIFGWSSLIRIRRMLGLFSFFYALLHITIYITFDQSLDIVEIINDIFKRPFITIGVMSFLLMLPLALTSSNYAIRYLTGKKWKQLHQLVYLVGIGAVIHFLWLAQSKAYITEPLIYMTILAMLLLVRHPPIMQKLKR